MKVGGRARVGGSGEPSHNCRRYGIMPVYSGKPEQTSSSAVTYNQCGAWRPRGGDVSDQTLELALMVLIPRRGMAEEHHMAWWVGDGGRKWRMWMGSERTYVGLQGLDGS